MVQQVKEAGVAVRYPMLTRTNYTEWALLMRVNLQAQGVWEAIEPGDAGYRLDRMALSAILQVVPLEMLATLAAKDSAKLAWETVRMMRMGVERVREAKAQTLRKEFETIRMSDGESIDDFAMRLTGLVNNIRTLGDTLEEEKVVKKFLRVVPSKYTQVAISIEQLIDLKTLVVSKSKILQPSIIYKNPYKHKKNNNNTIPELITRMIFYRSQYKYNLNTCIHLVKAPVSSPTKIMHQFQANTGQHPN